jgi:hypothetical protein
VRERYGIADGPSQLEATETPDGIILRPVGDVAPLVEEKGGWMVFQAGDEDSLDPVAAVDEARAARSRSVLASD